MKILVTGATGFIGKYVVNELLKYNHQVTPVSKKIYDINNHSRPYYEHVNPFKSFGQPDMLIHLAWEGLPNYNELFHIERNLWNNYRFLKNMIENGLKHLVVAGTCFEYGMQDGRLDESMDTRPNTSYGLAKDTLRKCLEQLQNKIDFDLKWLRLFYIHGKEGSILSLLDKALNNNDSMFNMSGGQQIRDYLPVETIAEYIVKIAMQNEIYGIINCCSGIPIKIEKLIRAHLNKQHKKIELNLGYYPYNTYEPMAFWGDTTKMNKALSI